LKNYVSFNGPKRNFKCLLHDKATFLIALCFFSYITVTRAQQIITGKIVDAVSRQPLESVNVEGAGSSHNTAFTDHYSSFSISVNDKNTFLLASYIGYKLLNISVAGKKNMRIEMQPDVVNLKDVIITSSSEQQKFNTLAKVDLDLKPVKNTQELLRLVPGLFVAQHAGGGKADKFFCVVLIVITEQIFR